MNNNNNNEIEWLEKNKRDNRIFAILDDETNSYMQSFIALNLVQAKRNFNIAKLNLKEQIKSNNKKDLEFINKLKLVELSGEIETDEEKDE